jgi:hypothetical protein
MNRWISVTFIFLALLGISSQTATANFILDGGFEQQAVLQNNPHYSFGPNGEKWGAAYGSPVSTANSWQNNFNGAWSGGAIARTEDYTTGWKWARSGVVFGVLQAGRTLSQTFTATKNETLQLSWYDANRNSWRGDTWFGRQANYQVSVTEGTTTIAQGNYTSKVYGGLESNSQINASDDRFLPENKKGWFSKSLVAFNVEAGKTYTVSFAGTSSDDRTTLLDDVSISAVPEPSSLGLLSLGALGCAFLRRRRHQG